MIREFRYAGPDGEGISALPPGVGAAVGSEYCVHLLPGAPEMARAAAAAAARGIPLLLLTPYFRDAELKRSIPVFRAIPAGADVTLAVNDWGALLSLRVLFPRLTLTVGRLLSGQKRCPRIGISARLTPCGRAWHAQGLFASERGRDFLEKEYGVRGFHVDRLPWCPDASPSGVAGGPDIFVHEPFAIVTVTDRCPWIGGTSSSAVGSCPRSCRRGAVRLSEPSMGQDLLLRGKARFVRIVGNASCYSFSGGEGDKGVVYDDLP